MELRNITFLKLGEITHADKGMNPIHFGSDRIRINPEIRIQIPDHMLA